MATVSLFCVRLCENKRVSFVKKPRQSESFMRQGVNLSLLYSKFFCTSFSLMSPRFFQVLFAKICQKQFKGGGGLKKEEFGHKSRIASPNNVRHATRITIHIPFASVVEVIAFTSALLPFLKSIVRNAATFLYEIFAHESFPK